LSDAEARKPERTPPDEAREWLELLDSSDFAKRKDLPDLVRFLLGTRCRLGEAVGVRWDDLDLDRHLLHVRRTIIRVRGARTRSEAAQDAIR